MRVPALLLLAAAALPCGCIQADEALSLFPDGSGKMVMKVAVKKSMIKLMEESARAQGAPAGGPTALDFRDPLRLLGESEGFAALKPGPSVEDGDWIRTSITAYFEDINKVRLYQKDKASGERRISFSARFTKTADGGRLSITNRLHEFRQGFERSPGGAKSPEAIKASLEFMKPMLQDFSLVLRVSVPGAIRDSAGFASQEGRTVSTSLDADKMTALLGDPESEEAARLRKLSDTSEATVAWTGEAAAPEELAAFRAELAAARAGGAPAKPPSLAAEAESLTDDEVERLFIDAQLRIARQYLERGEKDKARELLQGILKDYPKAKAAQAARKLLESIR